MNVPKWCWDTSHISSVLINSFFLSEPSCSSSSGQQDTICNKNKRSNRDSPSYLILIFSVLYSFRRNASTIYVKDTAPSDGRLKRWSWRGGQGSRVSQRSSKTTLAPERLWSITVYLLLVRLPWAGLFWTEEDTLTQQVDDQVWFWVVCKK